MKPILVKQQTILLTLEEVCDRCTVDKDFVIKLVEYGVIEPEDESSIEWVFTSTTYLRIRKALRLQQDLSLNEPGIALALDLLDEMNKMKEEIDYLRQRVQRKQN